MKLFQHFFIISLLLLYPNSIFALIIGLNLFFISIATYYGDVIGLGALFGEVNGDKSIEFKKGLESVLLKCYEKSYWSEGRNIHIEYPVAEYTKAELISKYIASGGNIDSLLLTWSCYDDKDLPCGICANCIKRYIALTLNGLSEKTLHDPFTSNYIDEMFFRFPTYSDKRKKEIQQVFGKKL